MVVSQRPSDDVRCPCHMRFPKRILHSHVAMAWHQLNANIEGLHAQTPTPFIELLGPSDLGCHSVKYQ